MKGLHTVETILSSKVASKGANTSELVLNEQEICDIMLHAYLLGVLSAMTDQQSYLELRHVVKHTFPSLQ